MKEIAVFQCENAEIFQARSHIYRFSNVSVLSVYMYFRLSGNTISNKRVIDCVCMQMYITRILRPENDICFLGARSRISVSCGDLFILSVHWGGGGGGPAVE